MSIESESMEIDYNDILSMEIDEYVDVNMKILSPNSNILSALNSPSKQNSFNEEIDSFDPSFNRKQSVNTPADKTNNPATTNFFITVSPIKEQESQDDMFLN